MNSKIFKAYDIRGVYPEELNEEMAYKIGLAFIKFTNAKNILVGEDARVSSPSLRDSLVKGLRSAGANVFLAGELTTPMFYFGVAEGKNYDAGIMVTASHNPGKYNGFKLVKGDLLPIGEGSGMEEIRDLAINGDLPTTKEGELHNVEIKNNYIKKVLSLISLNSIKPLKIVIDTGNGMEGTVLPDLLKNLLQLDVTKLFFDVDMSFPNHEANPLKEETLESLKKEVVRQNANLGVAYDGDADRIGFVDEKGETVRADYILTLLLENLYKKYPGSITLYDLRCSKIVPETIKKLEGTPKMTRVGHAFIKKNLREYNAIAAGELSSHFYFKDFYGVECGELVMLYILQLLSEKKAPFSQIVSPFKKYYQSGEINFEVEDKESKIKELKEKYSDNATDISELDGIRIEFNNEDEFWWFNVRASNTEPLLRLNLEASNEKLLQEKLEELSSFIKK